MPGLREIVRSSIGRKLINGLTGLLLCAFIVGHLIGNLLLVVGQEAFNEYTHFLEHLGHGLVVPVAEVGLVLLFLSHAVAGIQVWLTKRRARSPGYVKVADAGGPSRKTLASRSMIVTGSVLLAFVIVHVAMFRLELWAGAPYETMIDGERARDLYALVVDWFQNPAVVAAYVAVMVLLGVHLRHGFWSAFQTLGATNPKYLPFIYAFGIVFAVVMAVGFLFLPIYLHLFVDPAAGAGAITGGG